jgi:hypothetical protein
MRGTTILGAVVLGLALAVAVQAGTILPDVTQPGDPIVGTSNHYPGGTDPNGPNGAEAPQSAIDNIVNDNGRSKYLNFDKQNSGFIVTPSIGATYLTGIALTTANDSAERDPFSVSIYGSNNLTALTDGQDIPSGDWTAVLLNLDTSSLSADRWIESEFAFTALTGEATFGRYKVIFPTIRNDSANSMQIGEVRLIGATPEPATLALLALGGLGLIARRRRA